MECSILKVLGSEALERVTDHALQIHGGYGYVEEYPAERSYRDARINRIFEGTNEINRLIATGFMIKRAVAGTLPLMPAIKRVMDEVMAGPGERVSYDGPMAWGAGAAGEREEDCSVCFGSGFAAVWE